MHSVLFDIGPLTLYTYGFILAVSFLVSIWVAAWRAGKFGFTRDSVYDSVFPVLISALAGAKLFYLAIEWDEFLRGLAAGPGAVISLLRGGLVYYGGVLGGSAGAVLWLWRRKLPVLGFGDMAAPALAIGHALGRIGCFFNGCCYGRPVAWGIVLPELSDGLPRHPVQLYEAGGSLLIALALLARGVPRPERRGEILGTYLASYSILRFALEYLRDDPRGPVVLGLSIAQLMSAVALLIGLWLVLAPGLRGQKGRPA